MSKENEKKVSQSGKLSKLEQFPRLNLTGPTIIKPSHSLMKMARVNARQTPLRPTLMIRLLRLMIRKPIKKKGKSIW
jgi:hypothetical protein